MKREYQKYSNGKPYHVIAVCYAHFHDAFSFNIVKALSEQCDQAKCKMIVFSTCSDLSFDDANDQGEKAFAEIMATERFDAIVLLTETFKEQGTANRIVEKAKAAKVPLISVDKSLEGCYNINFCYGNSFEKIVRHVVEDHHLTRVNFIAGMEGNSFSEERMDCYKKVLKENGIPIEEKRIGYGDFWEGPAKNAVDDFLNSGLELPEAIVCANDAMAIAVCQKLKEEGYRVPGDIIVTGFDGIELEKYHSPRLTTAEYNMSGLVDTIFSIVEATAKGIEIPMEYSLDYKFRMSCSCGCVPIEIVDMSDKIYQLAMQDKETEYFNEQAYRMVSHLSNLPDLQHVFHEFESYLRPNDCSHLWVCTNGDMLDEQYDFIRELKYAMDTSNHPFRDIMYIPVWKNHQKFSRGDRVDRADLIPHFDQMLEEKNSILVLPLHAEELPIGYVAACFNFQTMRVNPYHALIVNFMHVMNNYRIQEERENYFSRDMLTNLYNRRGFYKYINGVMDACVFNDTPLAVISIDMDGLKSINDYYGHKEGDYALHKLSEAMLLAIREGEYAARFGGDEFIIAFGNHQAEQRVDEIIDRIKQYVNEFNQTKKKDYMLGASYGTYVGIPSSKSKLDDYIKYADNAMYLDKARHKREQQRL